MPSVAKRARSVIPLHRARARAAHFLCPLRLAVFEDGSTHVVFDTPESLMGSFGSETARQIGRSLNEKLFELVEQAL